MRVMHRTFDGKAGRERRSVKKLKILIFIPPFFKWVLKGLLILCVFFYFDTTYLTNFYLKFFKNNNKNTIYWVLII